MSYPTPQRVDAVERALLHALACAHVGGHEDPRDSRNARLGAAVESYVTALRTTGNSPDEVLCALLDLTHEHALLMQRGPAPGRLRAAVLQWALEASEREVGNGETSGPAG
jgi:hypothetical protein